MLVDILLKFGKQQEWKCITCIYIYINNRKFLWASDEINKRPNDYWLRVLDLARKFNVTRIKRCG